MRGIKIITENRNARHEYTILESIECGIVLQGNEVKSLRYGNSNLKDAWCTVENGQLIIKQMYIADYDKHTIMKPDTRRERVLLVHKREIVNLGRQLQKEGVTLIPLKCYFKDSKVKVEVAVAKGKKLYDKRACEAEKSAKLEMARAIKEHRNRSSDF